MLAQGVRALLSPSSPVVVPRRPTLGLFRFLTGFARHSTRRQWQAGMGAYLPLNALALEAFDRLAQGGVQEHAQEADPFLACYRTTEDRRVLLDELEQIAAAGQDVKFEAITGDEARRDEPALSPIIGAAIRIHGQRYIHPPRFMDALAASFRARGGRILTGVTVTHLRDEVAAVAVVDTTGTLPPAPGVGDLVKPFGVRHRVQAGRGYSFTVQAQHLPAGPLYFPTQRIACTPLKSITGDRR